MAAVLKRELGSYFRSPIGYTIIAIFYFFANIFFNMYCLSYNSGNMSSVFQNTFLIVLFIIPIITMKTFSEDKKLGTDKLLLTSPVSTGRIVFGKYLSAMIIYVICLLIFVVHGLIIEYFSTAQWSVILCTVLGLALMGSAIISIGLFISSLTESQVIACVGTLGVGFFLYIMDVLANLANNAIVSYVVGVFTFIQRFSNFTLGIFNPADVLYFLSVTCLFLWFTMKSFGKNSRS